ncbi:MAG TPA: type II toxin-antitoxin system prevent-host-death family antitoxin [Geminicoccaceae bacterium]|nr:type II toxin-antitoxin system prevent-host-death family antitoxin [Geminicoccaceae bacterium]
MKAVGILEARRTLLALLERVRQGEEIVITRHGKAVARLVPVGAANHDRLMDTVARLKDFRRGRRLRDLSVKALIEEGRR